MPDTWRLSPPLRLAGSKGWCAYAELWRDGKTVPYALPVGRHGTVHVFKRADTPCEALRRVREVIDA